MRKTITGGNYYFFSFFFFFSQCVTRTPLFGLGMGLKFKLLMEKGAHVNVVDKTGKTPIFYAKDTETLSALIKKGAKVNYSKPLDGQTPLHHFIRLYDNDRKEERWPTQAAIKMLIDAGGNMESLDNRGKKPSDYTRDVELLEFLLMVLKQRVDRKSQRV